MLFSHLTDNHRSLGLGLNSAILDSHNAKTPYPNYSKIDLWTNSRTSPSGSVHWTSPTISPRIGGGPLGTLSGGHSFSINLNGIKNALRLTREGLIAVKVYNATSTMTVTGVPLHLVMSLNHCMLQA